MYSQLAYYDSQLVNVKHANKKPLDNINRGVIHHVGEKGNHSQYKTRIHFTMGWRGDDER